MRVYEVLTSKTHNIAHTSHAPSPFLNKRDAMFHKDLAVAARPRGHCFFLESQHAYSRILGHTLLLLHTVREHEASNVLLLSTVR